MKRYIIIGVVAALILGTHTVARPDDTIVFDLDEGTAQSAPKKEIIPPRKNPAPAKNTTSSRSPASMITTSPYQSKSDEAVIGRLGVVSADKAAIYSKRSTKSSSYTVCPKGTYLALISETSEWYGVMMVDGRTAWILKDRVQLLNYNVVAKQSIGTLPIGSQIVQCAFRYMGIPYKWSGTSLNGMDCSGYVQKVFARFGVRLPRTAREQARVGTSVSRLELMPGDRLYFSCKGKYIDHTGIYIGNNMFVHSSVSNKGVAIDDLGSSKYNRALVVAMR